MGVHTDWNQFRRAVRLQGKSNWKDLRHVQTALLESRKPSSCKSASSSSSLIMSYSHKKKTKLLTSDPILNKTGGLRGMRLFQKWDDGTTWDLRPGQKSQS